MNTKLAKSNEDLQSFAYVASHDLQEPLRKIRTFGTRLQERCSEELSDKGKDYLERMVNASERMSILIEDLLSFSSLNSRAKPTSLVSLMDILDEVLNDNMITLQENDAKIETSELPEIEGEKTQLRQIFQNLIGNSLKFHRLDVRPRIKIWHEASENILGPVAKIFIEDNGIGIEPEYHKKVFVVFSRLHSRDVHKGSGIGLSVCKKIMDRHHGTVKIKSNETVGCTFILTFPLQQPQLTK